MASLFESGEAVQATVACAALIRQEPENQEALNLLIEASIEVDRGREAYAVLLSLAGECEANQKIHMSIGDLLFLLGIGKIFLPRILLAIRTNPSEPGNYWQWAGILRSIGCAEVSRAMENIGDAVFDITEPNLRSTSSKKIVWSELQRYLNDTRLEEIDHPDLLEFFSTVVTDNEVFWNYDYFHLLSAVFGSLGYSALSGHLSEMGDAIRRALIGGSKNGVFSSETKWNGKRAINNRHETDGKIIFVAAVMSPRVLKLATALRHEGKYVKLLARHDVEIYGFGEGYFDEIVVLDGKFDCWSELSSSNPEFIHAFLNLDNGFFEGLTAFLLHPDKTIFDFYDLSDQSISPISLHPEGSEIWAKYERWDKIQRFLMNHAIGLCGRYLNARIQKSRIPEVSSRQKRIYLPEFSWGNTPKKEKLSKTDNMLHLVHGGTFWNEAEDGSWACIYELGKRTEELGIHLHLYPISSSEQSLDRYRELSDTVKNFHLHLPVEYFEWLSVIEQYDIGFFYIPADGSKEKGGVFRMQDPSGAWANKFGDFVDGELYSVMTKRAKAMAFMAERYGIGEGVSQHQVLRKDFWEGLKQKILEEGVDFSHARNKFSITRHGKRLIKFYEETTLQNI